MVFSDCLPGTQRKAPSQQNNFISRTGCVHEDECIPTVWEQFLYHPFIPKLLRCRAVAVKPQWKWAVPWLCWAMGSANCAQPWPSTPLCFWCRVQHEEPAWEPSWVSRAQSKHGDSLQELSDTSASALLIARACSELCSSSAFALPSSFTGLHGGSQGNCSSCKWDFAFLLILYNVHNLTINFNLFWTFSSKEQVTLEKHSEHCIFVCFS